MEVLSYGLGGSRGAPSPGLRAASLALSAPILCAILLFAGLLRGVPKVYDLPDHLGSIWQVLHGFERGDFYPRWLSEFNDGFGEAMLVYYPPMLYFVSAGLAWLLGGDVLTGLYLTLFLFAVLGGLGMFLLVRRVFGAAAGAVATIAFAFLPYRVFEVYASGLYSAFAAGCLLPWGLVALARIAEAGQESADHRPRQTWALIFASIVVTNMPTAVFVTYLVGAWIVVETLATRRLRFAAEVLLGTAWGALMAGVYLLPAILETRWLQIPLETVYSSNFLFQSSGSWMTPGLKSLFDRMGLFPALALLLSLGVLAAVRQRGEATNLQARVFARLVGTFGLASLFLATPLSVWAWRWFPQLHRVNMPWRLLEPLGVATVSAAAAAGYLLWRRKGLWTAFKLLALFFFACLAVVCAAFDASISVVNGQMTARTCRALIPSYARKECYFLPKGARRAPEISGLPAVACGQPCEVQILEGSPTRRRLRVRAAGETRIALRTYFFPGWRAERTDGRRDRLPISSEPGTGRITIGVPAGESLVDVRFGTTPTRVAGGVLSGLAFAAWAARVLSLWRAARAERSRDEAR